MGSALRALLRIERPFDVILDKTMSGTRPRYDRGSSGVNLAGGGPQRAPNHLAIEAHLARWPGDNFSHPTSGISQPSVKTTQLVTNSISPDANRCSVESRSGFGVDPSYARRARRN